MIIFAWVATPCARSESFSELSWDTLDNARWIQTGASSNPAIAEEMEGYVELESKLELGADVKALDGGLVRIRGFMVPLEVAERHAHFILSKHPLAHCRYCQPGGMTTVIEVLAKEALEFTFDAVTVRGRFELSRDDPNLIYRLKEAEPAG